MYKNWASGKCSYRIYEDGTIIREAREGVRGHIIAERTLKQHMSDSGYARVSINTDKGNKEMFVHRLVAKVFIPNPNNYNVVDHVDGNKSNNHFSNLEWVSSSENNHRAYATGLKNPTRHKGEKHPQAKLRMVDVDYIRAYYKRGDEKYGQCALARKFGVSQAEIYDVINYNSWAENDPEEDDLK